MNWYREALRKYATFDGRSRRREYWFFALFNFLILVALSIVDMGLGSFSEEAGIGLLGGLFCLGIILPSIAVTVRRLHDTNRSGWWILINLIPLVGAIVLLVFTVLDSQPGGNKYGPNPKGVLGPGTASPVVVRE